MPESKIGPTRPYWQEPEIVTPSRFEIFIRDTLYCDVEFIPLVLPWQAGQESSSWPPRVPNHRPRSHFLQYVRLRRAAIWRAAAYRMAKKRTGWQDEMLQAWGVEPVSKEELHSKYIHLLPSRDEQADQMPQFGYHTNMLHGYSWSESARRRPIHFAAAEGTILGRGAFTPRDLELTKR